MCEQGDTTFVAVFKKSDIAEIVQVDRCIARLVQALNTAGIKTIASCCGHGNRPGNIALADGSELVICPDYDTARAVDRAFPDIHGKTIGGDDG